MAGINWEQYQAELDTLVTSANTRTNVKLASEVARVSRLTDSEIKRLFPKPTDAQRVAELMEIIKRSGNRNEKINRITRNAEHFGDVIFTLLKKLA
ncbi:MAG: hypothetical protein V3U76_00080 [Granulosicoccus sp.]